MATIRAWNSTLGQYVYWTALSIADPMVDYPNSYPNPLNLSNFVILDYSSSVSSSSQESNVLWDSNVSDGYFICVGIDGYGNTIGRLCTAYDPGYNVPSGISTSTNNIRATGEYNIWCDTTTQPGDELYISTSNSGMVSARNRLPESTVTLPNTVITLAAISLTIKDTSYPSKIRALIKIGSPIYLDNRLDLIN